MSASTLNLKVISPEGTLLETEAASVQFPGEDGLFGVLPRHAPMTSLTESGLLRARTAAGDQVELIIHDGFAQVRGDQVTVLTRSAEKPDEIDLERAKSAVERARERMRADRTEIDLIRAQMALRRALMRERYARR